MPLTLFPNFFLSSVCLVSVDVTCPLALSGCRSGVWCQPSRSCFRFRFPDLSVSFRWQTRHCCLPTTFVCNPRPRSRSPLTLVCIARTLLLHTCSLVGILILCILVPCRSPPDCITSLRKNILPSTWNEPDRVLWTWPRLDTMTTTASAISTRLAPSLGSVDSSRLYFCSRIAQPERKCPSSF